MSDVTTSTTITEVKGDKYVNGRRAILQALDVVLAKAENIKVFSEAFEAQLKDAPLATFRVFVMPLLPKEILIGSEENTCDFRIELVPAKPRSRHAEAGSTPSETSCSQGPEGTES